MQDSSAAGTIVVNKTKYFACAEPLTLYVRGLTEDEKTILLQGCLMNYYAAQNR